MAASINDIECWDRKNDLFVSSKISNVAIQWNSLLIEIIAQKQTFSHDQCSKGDYDNCWWYMYYTYFFGCSSFADGQGNPKNGIRTQFTYMENITHVNSSITNIK